MYQTISKRFEPMLVKLDQRNIVVPDMSFTPREIIQKFSRGEKVPLGFNGLFDGEDDPDHLGDNDPSIWEDDPTRDPNFDRFDYVEEKNALEERRRDKERHERARRAKERSNDKDLPDLKRKASDEELSASDATKRETTSEGAGSPPTAK